MNTASNLALPPSTSCLALAESLGCQDAPIVCDVRRAPAFAIAKRVIAGALRLAPEALDASFQFLPKGRRIVVYCVHGHEVSQNAAASLRSHGLDASFLEGGFSGWETARLPTMLKNTALFKKEI